MSEMSIEMPTLDVTVDVPPDWLEDDANVEIGFTLDGAAKLFLCWPHDESRVDRDSLHQLLMLADASIDQILDQMEAS